MIAFVTPEDRGRHRLIDKVFFRFRRRSQIFFQTNRPTFLEPGSRRAPAIPIRLVLEWPSATLRSDHSHNAGR